MAMGQRITTMVFSYPDPQKNNTVVSGNAGDAKIFTQAAAKKFFIQHI